MSSRLLLNLGLVIIAIALALVIYFRPGIEPETVPQPLTDQLGPDDATGIHVKRVIRDPLEFIRRDGRWYLMFETSELPASEFQIQALLRLLETTSSISYPADTLDLDELGLEPPRVTVTIDDVVIRFGVTEALNNHRYAQIENTVHLVDDRYQHLVNADWSNFVSRKLLPDNTSITRLQLPDITLTRDDDNQWHTEPESPPHSSDTMQQLLDHWQSASALYVRRYNEGNTGEVIHIETGNESEAITFYLLAHTPELVLARPDWGIQYHLTGSVVDNLLNLEKPDQEMDTAARP